MAWYLTQLKKIDARNNQTIRKKFYSYKSIKEKIDSGTLRYVFDSISKDLSQREITQLADEFLAEKNIDRKIAYLRVFAAVAFPYGPSFILKTATQLKNKAYGELYLAGKALRFFQDDTVRKWTIDHLYDIGKIKCYLWPLMKNYQQGDAKWLAELIRNNKELSIIHELSVISDIYAANKTKECREPLELLYRKMNCGICRVLIVRTLIKNKALSDVIRRELPFDCDDDVRKIVT